MACQFCSYYKKTRDIMNQVQDTHIPTTTFDVEKVRKDFPILHQEINGKPLVYFDNAATTQKPQVVIDALSNYYSTINANIHRGIHTLAEKATAEYEATRDTIQRFINARYREEIIFTRGVTEGINLLAGTFGQKYINEGDEIIISTMEHHSNIVPWQMLCEAKGAVLKIIPIDERGDIILEEYEKLLTDRTKLVAVVHVSNALGTINPVKQIIDLAHAKGIKVMLDGAQASSHITLDVQELDVDFYVFSAHKLYGPTGIGALYGKKELLDDIPPYHGGGEMIKEVTFAKTTYNELPYKFEAGTPNIGDTVAFRHAIEYVNTLGKETIAAYENELLAYATEQLELIEGLRVVGTAREKISVISFVIDGVHHQDLAILLDNDGIAIRTGHHCAQPLMDRFNILGTSRASFSFYNTKEEVDRMITAIKRAVRMLK
jgi:cysteine desulfurase / selenocysteine lyase